MTHEYSIPSVEVGRSRAVPWLIGAGLVLTVLLARHVWFLVAWNHYQDLTWLWMAYFVLTGGQWVLSWLERPIGVNPGQRAGLDRLRVTVNVPLFNEDPEVLDRALYALFQQSRLPERVQVVDDGSSVDYSEVEDWWAVHHSPQVSFSWVRQPNAGKKAAQATTFRDDPADVFVTLDSDTVLEQHALDEGLKPFAEANVQSVAGLELAWNYDRNFLTRINSTRQLMWELVTCSAQSVFGGNVLINRGTFALYRGQLVRDVLPAYLGETFFGRRVLLGDDTFLTTQALLRGRAVQQPSAVCLTMYPERVSHQMRQWTRWMRGTTLRTFWRLRYLRVMTWGWLYTVISLWWFLSSLAITAVLVVLWPRSAPYTQAMLLACFVWAWIMGSRLLVVRRSDQGLGGRLGGAAIAPISALWVIAVLRLARIYGTFTVLRQGWNTRSRVEVWAEGEASTWAWLPGVVLARGMPHPRARLMGMVRSPGLWLALSLIGVTVAAFHLTLMTYLGLIDLPVPTAYLSLFPLAAAGIGLLTAMRYRDSPTPIRDRQLDLILSVPLALGSLFLICVTPVLWGAFYWSLRPDLLAVAAFATAGVVLTYGVGWAWRLRGALLLLLLMWPGFYQGVPARVLTTIVRLTGVVATTIAAHIPLGLSGAHVHAGEVVVNFSGGPPIHVPFGVLAVSGEQVLGFGLIGVCLLLACSGSGVRRLAWLGSGLAIAVVMSAVRLVVVVRLMHAGFGSFALGDFNLVLALCLFASCVVAAVWLFWRLGLNSPPGTELSKKSRYTPGSAGVATAGHSRASLIQGISRRRALTLGSAALVVAGVFGVLDQGLGVYSGYVTGRGIPRVAAFAAANWQEPGREVHLVRSFQNAAAYFGHGATYRQYRLTGSVSQGQRTSVLVDVVVTRNGATLEAEPATSSFIFGIFRLLQVKAVGLGHGLAGTVINYRSTSGHRQEAGISWTWPVTRRGQNASELVLVTMRVTGGIRRSRAAAAHTSTDEAVVLGFENLVNSQSPPPRSRATQEFLSADSKVSHIATSLADVALSRRRS
ncbi:MAG: glycosyltransferase [Candidatus Dormiibacterota bacterium]